MFFSVNAMEQSLPASLPIEGAQESFQTVQRILNIVEETIAAFQPRSENMRNGRDFSPDPLYAFSQTKSGLFFQVGALPSRLFTPWGDMLILGESLCNYLWNLAFTQDFFKRFKVIFVGGIRELERDQAEYYELKQKDLDIRKHLLEQEQLGNSVVFEDLFRKLSKEELELRKGTETMVVTHLGSTLFAIEAVETIAQPKAELLERRYFTDTDCLLKNWQELQAAYTDR